MLSKLSLRLSQKIKQIFRSNYNILLVIILILGFLLSFTNITAWDIHNNEAILIFTSQQSLQTQSQIIKTSEYNPPLYNFILYVWGLFGKGLLWFRLLSAIIYTLLIFYVYKLSSYIINQKTGLVTALLVSLSYKILVYGRFVKHYILITLLSVISIYTFLKLLDQKNLKNKIYFAIITFLGLYTSYLFYFIIVTELIYTLFKKQKLLFKKLILLTVIFSIPLLPLLVTHLKSFIKGYPVVVPELKNIPLFIYHITRSIILSITLSVLAIFSITTQFKKNIHNHLLLIFLYFLLPIILIFLFSKFISSAFHFKYLLMFFPAFYILAAKGLTSIKNKYIKVGAIVFIVFISFYTIKSIYTKPYTSTQEMSDCITSNIKKQDIIIHTSPYTYWPISFYVDDRISQIVLSKQKIKKYNSGGYLKKFINIKDNLPLNQKNQRFWVVESFKFKNWNNKNNTKTFKNNPNFTLMDKWNFINKNLYLYKTN